MWVTRAISFTNFTVASSALGFQVFVLYPWHEELQHDFNKLRSEHLESLRSVKADVEELKREHIRVLEALKSELQSTRSRGILGFGSTAKS